MIDFGGANLTPEANAAGAAALPYINEWVFQGWKQNIDQLCSDLLTWKPVGPCMLGMFRFQSLLRKPDCLQRCAIQEKIMQAGEGYPGWQLCNPIIPHAKWSLLFALFTINQWSFAKLIPHAKWSKHPSD